MPLAAAQLAQAATAFIDTVMMGVLGREILAAGSLAAMTFAAVLISGTGMVSAVSPLVAEAFGAGQGDRIARITRQGLWLSVIVALPVMVLLWFTGDLLKRLGQDPAIATLAERYLQAIL